MPHPPWCHGLWRVGPTNLPTNTAPPSAALCTRPWAMQGSLGGG